MKVLLAASMAALLFIPRAEAHQKTNPSLGTLPVFSFLGDDTETITTRTELNQNKCSQKGDVLECDDYRTVQLAGTELKWLSISYYKGKLYQVISSTWTNRYSILLEAFTAKYGKPEIEIRKWQAKSGATFDNSVAIGRFKGGTLELKSLGVDLNSAGFTFVSSLNSPPREKPTIDF